MLKLLMATAAMVGASLGMANAAQVFTSQPGSTISHRRKTQTWLSPGRRRRARPPPIRVISWYGWICGRTCISTVCSWGSADSVNGNKQAPVNIIGYPRFYTGFDGQATNGLKYGMFDEIRINGAGNFAGSSSGNPGISGNSGSGTLFWRRDFGYVGTAQAGTLRMGQTDGPMSLFLIGNIRRILRDRSVQRRYQRCPCRCGRFLGGRGALVAVPGRGQRIYVSQVGLSVSRLRWVRLQREL